MAAKYKEFFNTMLENHKEMFDSFKEIHDKYAEDPEKYKTQFNEQGQDVLRIIRRVENQLCGRSESSGYGKYSTGLSDKFWGEVRTHFPKIDFVGTL